MINKVELTGVYVGILRAVVAAGGKYELPSR